MKLIIDIPYEAYHTFKSDLGKGNLNALAEIVANGTPYEERPQGKWIENWYSDYGVYYQCSICHKMPPNYECDYKEGAIKTNFCPNCGARMVSSEKTQEV